MQKKTHAEAQRRHVPCVEAGRDREARADAPARPDGDRDKAAGSALQIIRLACEQLAISTWIKTIRSSSRALSLAR
jgi:hypothetical protein